VECRIKCKKIQDESVEDERRHKMYKDGIGNSLNHELEEEEGIKKMDGWTDEYTG
jgi:hypothetical protein